MDGDGVRSDRVRSRWDLEYIRAGYSLLLKGIILERDLVGAYLLSELDRLKYLRGVTYVTLTLDDLSLKSNDDA